MQHTQTPGPQETLPPQTPTEGPDQGLTGLRKRAAFTKAIQAHKQLVLDALDQADLAVVPCSFLWDESSFHKGCTRQLKQEFLLVCSSKSTTPVTEDEKERLLCLWANSKLFSRAAVPCLVPAMPRKAYANWTNSVTMAETPRLSVEAERQQYTSGHQMLGLLLEGALEGISWGPDDKVLVRDYTMYDAELALACMNHNAKQGKPVVGYAGTCWIEMHSVVVKNNVEEAITDQLRARSKAGSYALCKVRHQYRAPVLDNSDKPTYQEEMFQVTRPRDLDLPIRQSAYDLWGTAGVTLASGMTFADMVKLHDAEFNPSGVPAKTGLKRALETDDSTAVQLSSSRSAGSAVDLPVVSRMSEEAHVIHVNDNFDLIVPEDGGLVLRGKEDSILSLDEPLFSVHGKWKWAEAADQTMSTNPDGAWIPYVLTADTLVNIVYIQPQPEWPQGLQKLGSFLAFVEGKLNSVRVDIKNHKYHRSPEDPQKFVVTCSTNTILQIPVLEGQVKQLHSHIFAS